MDYAMDASEPFALLRLPPEIRLQIYSHVLNPADNIRPHPKHPDCETYHFRDLLPLLLTSRAVSQEVTRYFYTQNTFVRIETPWEEAQTHIEEQGLIPLVCVGERAERFRPFYLGLEIRCPAYESHMLRHRLGLDPHAPLPEDLELDPDVMPTCKLVIMVEHLAAFCRVWFYSDISNPGGLNGHLELSAHLRNPNARDAPVPKALQRELLTPLGTIRGLATVRFTGEVYQSIEQAVREEMARPYTSPEDCLEQCREFKDRGDLLMRAGQWREAVEAFEDAFYSIHIICKGRRRHIWGDAFFDKQLTSGRYEGQHGEWVRIMMRLALVKQTVLAHLMLKDYEEAEFWGMRTVYIMRQRMGMDEDEDAPLVGFPAANDIGTIYFHTAIALKEQGKFASAIKLLKVAHGYLPNDQQVAAELGDVSSKLGTNYY